MKMKWSWTGLFLSIAAFAMGYLMGLSEGGDAGARQMARHVFHPAFHTESFVAIIDEESGVVYNPDEY